MKRYGNLYHKIIEFSNLLKAAKKAQKSKRFKPDVLAFNHNLETELIQLQQELTTKTYQPQGYHTFYIKEPKIRMISAANYRDRVVHHALCNIITPLIEPSFISDSYANRVGYGTHRGLERCREFVKSSDYVLQCDIQKYFPSIDHEILKKLIRKKIKCPDTLWLIDAIIDNSNEQFPAVEHFPDDDLLSPLNRKRGLPIGNLTSQFFANIYLNSLDHFIKEKLKVKKYVRYMDDFVLFADDAKILTQYRLEIEKHLVELRLKIHPIKSQIYATKKGVNFLGFRIFPTHTRVRNGNLRRARRRLKQMQLDYAEGKITLTQVIQSLTSWSAHLNYGDTWLLKQHIFSNLIFSTNVPKQ